MVKRLKFKVSVRMHILMAQVSVKIRKIKIEIWLPKRAILKIKLIFEINRNSGQKIELD